MMAQGALADFNEADFDARVLRRQGLTVIDFWSSPVSPASIWAGCSARSRPKFRTVC